MIYIDESYKQASKFQFPDWDRDPKAKDKEYCLRALQAMYSTHVRGKSGIPVDKIPEWEELRLYGKGMQNENQYINQLTGGSKDPETVNDVVSTADSVYNTKKERRKAWDNVNKQIFSLAPKIADYFYGLFLKQEYDVTANTIDEDSGALMENMKYRTLASSIFSKELALLRRAGNLPEPRQDFIPRDMTELELFESAGGFKLNCAMEMEKLLKHTFHISDWDNTTKRKLIDDARDIGYIAMREDLDEDTGKAKTRYIDITKTTSQYSDQFDFEDSDWQGVFEYWTVSQLRQKGFDEEFLRDLAGGYQGKFNNPYYSVDSDPMWGSRKGYDTYKIPVFVGYWIDMDAEYTNVFVDSKGRKRIEPGKYGKVLDTDKKKTRIKKDRFVYGGKWIIGTDKVFDEGKLYNQILKNEKPLLPIRIVKLTDNPITRRLRPIYDDMQIAWLKYQNAQIMAMNAGYAINVRLLNNIQLGGKKLSMQDVFDIMKETGNLFYSDTPIFGKYEGGAVNPVTPIPGGMGVQLQEAVTKFDWAVRMIEHETGLTPMSMGSTPRPDQGKATTEMSLMATQNVIRPIIDAIMVLKGRIAESAMLRIQLLINTSERSRKSYKRVIGRKGIETLRAAEGRAVAYGVDLEPRPTDEQKQRLYAYLEEAIALGRDGVKSAELDDAIMISRQLENGGNLKEIEMKIAYKIRKYKEQQQQKEAQMMQLQSQEVQKQNAQKAQFAAQEKQREAQLEAKKAQQEHGQNMEVETFKANASYKELLTQLAFDEKELELQQEMAKQKQE